MVFIDMWSVWLTSRHKVLSLAQRQPWITRYKKLSTDGIGSDVRGGGGGGVVGGGGGRGGGESGGGLIVWSW